MKLLQISDIHLNSQYDDKFPAKKHLAQILDATGGARARSISAVVLTGDLVENGQVTDYVDLLSLVQSTYGISTPVLVTPGNHDDRTALALAYDAFIKDCRCRDNSWVGKYDFNMYGSFKNPGESLITLQLYRKSCLGEKIPERKIVLMDTAHREFPYESLCKLVTLYKESNSAGVPYILFTHMPIIRPFHRFMNRPGYTIETDGGTFLDALAHTQCEAIVCGHYHCESYVKLHGISQFAGPASQAQIDSFSASCNPSGNYPGYAILEYDGGPVEYHTHYLPDDGEAEASP